MKFMLQNNLAGNLLRLFAVLFCAMLVTACGGGGGSPGNTTNTKLFTSAPSDLLISPAETKVYSISGGVTPYNVSSSAGSVIATVDGTQLKITAGGGGGSTLVVSDGIGASVSIKVTIGSGLDLFTTAGPSVTVGVGATSTEYTIGGGSQNYAISSSNIAVATVGINGNRFVINGVSGGKATVSVRDSVGKTVSIDVIVGSANALFTSAGADTTVAVGSTQTYLIGGGSTPYNVSSTNPSVATATVSGTTLTITGKLTGSSVVVISDGTGTSVKVNVSIGVPQALFTTAPTSVTLRINEATTYAVGGGTAPYTATSSNASIVTTSITGTTLTITGISAGTANVVIRDAVGGIVTLSVNAASVSGPALGVSPIGSSARVGDTLTFTITGGTPVYKVTSNNPSIATVAGSPVGTSGGTFTAALVNVGTTTFLIVDSAGLTQTVSVTVAGTSPLLRLSPNTITVDEKSTGEIPLSIFGGTGAYVAYTSDTTLAPVSISGSTLKVGAPVAGRCVPASVDVTVTVVDSTGASATSTLSINDTNGAGGC